MNKDPWMARLKILCSIIVFANLLPFILSSCGRSAPKAPVVYKPSEDTSDNVYSNPAMGWTLYLETLNDGIPENIEEYMASFSAESLEAGNIIYVRAAWSELEPTKGTYAWNDPDSWISKLEDWAVKHGRKLAFSVYVVSQDCSRVAVPDYVREDPEVAGNTHFRLLTGENAYSPNEDNPKFQQLFEDFLAAFAAKYDNPDLVDYIDANGMGLWGESHWSYYNYLTDDEKDQIYRWIISAYKSRFKKVLLLDNYVRDYWNGIDYGFRFYLRDWGLQFNGYSMRRNSLGSPYVFQYQKDRLKSNFPAKPSFGENYYHHFITSPYWNKDYSTLDKALNKVIADAKDLHCNTLDLRIPQDANEWTKNHLPLVKDFVRNGGYRLVPVSIAYPDEITSGESCTVSHSWKNTGVGVLPNNIENWNYKYKVAFALLDTSKGQPVYTFIDSAEPSDWEKGKVYEYASRITLAKVPKGTYDFAVAIVDRDKGYIPAIRLGITDERDSSGWYRIGKTEVKGNSSLDDIQEGAVTYTSTDKSPETGVTEEKVHDKALLSRYIGFNWGGKTVTTDRIVLSATGDAKNNITDIDVEYYDGRAWKAAAVNRGVKWADAGNKAEEKQILLGTHVVTNQLRVRLNSEKPVNTEAISLKLKVPGKLSEAAPAKNLSPFAIVSSTSLRAALGGTVEKSADGEEIILNFNDSFVRVNQIKLAERFGAAGGKNAVSVSYWNGGSWVEAVPDNSGVEEPLTLDYSRNNFAASRIRIALEKGADADGFSIHDLEIWGWGIDSASLKYDFARIATVTSTIPSDHYTPLYSINDGDETLAWESGTMEFTSSQYLEFDFQGQTAALNNITFTTENGVIQGVTKFDVF